MEDWMIGVYKGLRLPLLGMILVFITWYIMRPSKKKEFEQARFNMLDDDIDQNLSKERQEELAGASNKGES